MTLVAAAPSTQPSTAPVSPPLANFTSAEARVRFSYPADWTLPPKPLPRQLFTAQTPPLDANGRFAVISLQVDRGVPGPNDPAAMLDFSDALAAYAFNHGGQHVILKADTLGLPTSDDALPARRIRFLTPGISGTAATQYVVAVKDGTAYLFTVAAPAEIFDTAIAAATPMFQTFQRLQ